jgi:hypothetical protein
VGFDTALGGHGVKACSSVDTIAVSDGDGGHFELLGTLGQRFRLGGSGEEAEGAGGVELDVFHDR